MSEWQDDDEVTITFKTLQDAKQDEYIRGQDDFHEWLVMTIADMRRKSFDPPTLEELEQRIM